MPLWRTASRSILWFCLLASGAAAQAQPRPLRTDVPDLVPPGNIRLEFGLEFLQKQRYPLSGLEGDLTRLGVASVHLGLGEFAEFQISGVVQDFLSISRRTPAAIPPDFAGNATSDVGDLVLATKLRIAPEKDNRPALAFKFGVELPNASNESGLGTDETNFYAGLLLGKHLGRAQLVANLGLAILGSAVTPNSQADLLTYGIAAVIPLNRSVSLVSEVHGRQGPERLGNESRAQARFGAQIRSGGLMWDLAAVAGLKRFDADTGIVFGVTYEFQAFGRQRQPVRVK